MLIPQYKDAILEILALTFVVGAATVGSIAGQPSTPQRKNVDLPPRTLRAEAEDASAPMKAGDPGSSQSSPRQRQQIGEAQSVMLSIVGDVLETYDGGPDGGESPTIEVVTIEPNGTCRIYTAWCDAEQVLLEINARKERSHPSAPSPIP